MIRLSARLAAPVGLALLAACATATPYQPAQLGNDVSGGYSSEQLAPDRYRVSFSGNQYTSRERVENYLLFRAAQLAQQNGYTGFRVVRNDTDRDVDQELVTRPAPFGLGYGGFSPYWRFGGGFGSAFYDPYVGGPFYADTVDVRTIRRFDATAVIQLVRTPVTTGSQTYNAQDVITRLRDTIERPG